MTPVKIDARAEGDGPFRASARPPLLPIAGGRAVMLQRTTTRATRASWGGLILVVFAPMPFALLVLLDAALGVGVSMSLRIALSVAAGVATVLADRHTGRWVLHFDDTTTVLEDRRTGTAIRLTRENARHGLHRISRSAESASLPVIVLYTASGRVVVRAPSGILVGAEDGEDASAPHVIAPQQAVWDALRVTATRPPG